MSIVNLADYLARYVESPEQPDTLLPAEWEAIRNACEVVGYVAEIEVAKPGYFEILKSEASFAKVINEATPAA